jgi:hypothetical protein
MKAISDAIPGAEFTVVPGAPHMLSLERPTALAALLATEPTEVSWPGCRRHWTVRCSCSP